MIRALWFAVKIGLILVAALWVAARPGTVDIHWLGYDIRAHIGVVLAALLLIMLAVLFVSRIFWLAETLPARWRRYRGQKRHERGHRSLTLGLAAVAAGDAKLAGYHAFRARRFMPNDNGLPVLLEAQAARLKGDDDQACAAFETLLENKDTAFMGLRGLLLNALESGDHTRALELSRQALALHPKQPWIQRMTYDLELRLHHWDEARRLLDRAARSGALDDEKVTSDRMVILLQQAHDAAGAGNRKQALTWLKQAHRLDPSFVPAALWLARHYLEDGQERPAAAVIAATWKTSPHPELADLWREAIPKKSRGDNGARLAWFERLVALKPDSVEGQVAAAEEALEQNLWGTARQYLDRAAAIAEPDAHQLRLQARLAQAQDRTEEMALMLRRAAEAPPTKVWTCVQTGRVYDSWSPVALPHGSFNTIVWGYPQRVLTDAAANDRTELLITAPAARA